MVTERANLAQPLRSRIAAYEKSWYGRAKAAAQRFNCRDARFSVGETIVGNNQIGSLAAGGERDQGLAFRGMACDGITPTTQQGTHSVERQRVVIDQHDELRTRSNCCGLRYHGRLSQRWTCRDKGHRHGKARTLADDGFQFNWMVQESTKALDNGQ